MMRGFRALAALRFVRGTPVDPFARLPERQAERAALADYERLVDDVTGRLAPENATQAAELLRYPEMVRGYGHIRAASMKKAEAAKAERLARFETPEPVLREAAE
jgi:indolepyruvate ferredoxin oxidoreductase